MSLDLTVYALKEVSPQDRLAIEKIENALQYCKLELSRQEMSDEVRDFIDGTNFRLKDITASLEKCVIGSHNQTHNMTKLANHLGLYELLWRSNTENKHLVTNNDAHLISEAIKEINSHPGDFVQFEPPNKWGSVRGFLSFLISVHESVMYGRKKFGNVYFHSDV